MKLIAKDTLLVSAVQAEPLQRGQPFDLEDGEAKKLVERGLAEAAEGDAPAPGEKAAAPPKDKAERTTKNKSE